MNEATPFGTAREQIDKHVEAMADASIRISKVAHETADKVIRRQAGIAVAGIDAAMGGLQAAAGAGNVKDLMLSPARLMPENAARLAGDTRDVLDIMLGAGAEIREIVFDAVTELGVRNEAASDQPARPAASKRPRKTASKAKASKAAKAA